VSDLTENIDFKQKLDKLHKKVFEKFVPIIEQYLDQPGLQRVAPPPAGLAEAVTVIGMYESSKRIECYSKWLAGLTLVLIVLTAILTWRTFLP
jgi:radical SAM superfamily enzyme with C-terminal helix-hairpin-helix motif